jgi:hypothetical protein
MNITANAIRLQYNEAGGAELVLSCPTKPDISKLKEVVAKGNLLAVEVKQHRQKRSLNANAYMWVLLSKMAEVLHTTKDELYLIMLERYGQFTHIIVKPNVVGKVKQEWRAVRELGEVTVNGKKGIQLQCYFGSSTYDTQEMSVLIDGIVSEAKELGIETLPPEDLALLKQEWGMSTTQGLPCPPQEDAKQR